MGSRSRDHLLQVHVVSCLIFFFILFPISGVKADCEAGFLKCNHTGKCIRVGWICDGDNDCGDCEDETQCTITYDSATAQERCAPSQLYCSSSDKCISKGWICDGDNDCGNCYDENRCSADTIIQKNTVCDSTNSFYCTHSLKCIRSSWVCDGDNDCGDWDDERRCRFHGQTTTSTSTTQSTVSTTKSTIPTTKSTVSTTKSTVSTTQSTLSTTQSTAPTAQSTVSTTKSTVSTTQPTAPTTQSTVSTTSEHVTDPTFETTFPNTAEESTSPASTLHEMTLSPGVQNETLDSTMVTPPEEEIIPQTYSYATITAMPLDSTTNVTEDIETTTSTIAIEMTTVITEIVSMLEEQNQMTAISTNLFSDGNNENYTSPPVVHEVTDSVTCTNQNCSADCQSSNNTSCRSTVPPTVSDLTAEKLANFENQLHHCCLVLGLSFAVLVITVIVATFLWKTWSRHKGYQRNNHLCSFSAKVQNGDSVTLL